MNPRIICILPEAVSAFLTFAIVLHSGDHIEPRGGSENGPVVNQVAATLTSTALPLKLAG